MDEEPLESEPEKPRYLLPDGCKDLIDVIRHQQKDEEDCDSDPEITFGDEMLPHDLPASIELPELITVHDLALALHGQPYRIIAVLMENRIFSNIYTKIDFATASLVCKHYGVTPHKIP